MPATESSCDGGVVGANVLGIVIRYLQKGWSAQHRGTRLRREVMDGAVDVAGMLLRAGVPTRRMLRIALKVRSLVVLANPLLLGSSRVSQHDRQVLANRLAAATDGYPALQAFLNDCLDHVSGSSDMTALYLHLVHITRVMQLLDYAANAASEVAKPPSATSEKSKRSRRSNRSAEKPLRSPPARQRTRKAR